VITVGRRLFAQVIGAALLALVLSVGAPRAMHGQVAAASKRPAPPPIVLVKFKEPASGTSKVRAAGDRVLGTVGGRVHIVRLRPGASASARAAAYAKRSDVVYAEPAQRMKVELAAPNDPYGSAWWLNVIHALQGWSSYPNSYGLSGGVKVAITDTGIDPHHADLDAKIDAADGANCIHNDFSGVCRPWGQQDPSDPAGFGLEPLDDHGHGTHVAGIAGAEANNGEGVAGVGLNSPLIPVKVLDSDGFAFDFEIANGILWAKNHGASVINLSLGGPGLTSTLCNAVSQAVSAGVVVVAAAGNENTSTASAPAGCPGAIGVAATTSSDTRASFSNFGSPNVFVSAPGEAITSTVPGGLYESHSGTSMATPFVTGLVALLRSHQPITVAEVKHVLARTSDKVGGVAYGADPYHTCPGCTWNTYMGYGRINVENALHGITPLITGFTPATAAAGAAVTINGDALGTATSVTFTGAAPVAPTILSPTSLRVSVPADAGVGPITVTTPTGTAISGASFKPLARVTVPTTPVQAGDTVALSGSNLGDVTAVKIGTLALAPGSGGFTIMSPTELDLFIPDAALTGAVSLTTPAGTSVSGTPLKIRPTISEPFSPAHGFAGSLVTLSGKTFAGTSSVKLGGVTALFSILSSTSLRVTIPAGGMTGPISVTNAGGTSTTSGSFTVDPKITSFTPTSAAVGAVVTLSGSGFGASGESRVVTVNGVAASALGVLDLGRIRVESVTYVSANSLKFTVPAGATTGVIGLSVGSADPASSAAVLQVLPKVSGYSVAAAREGDAVAIQGTTLDGATSVKFGTINAAIDSIAPDGTAVQTHVPPGALSAAVTVVTPGGTSAGPVFKVLATIDEPFAPTHGVAGTLVTLSGKTFTGTTSVKVGGSTASFSILSSTSLRVTIPTAAVDGPIAVTNAGGTTSTATPFRVDPKLVSFSPLAAAGGANLTITGTGFGTSPVVQFGGAAAPATLAAHTPTSIVAIVPADAQNGQITVSTANGDAVSVTSFKPLMKITGFGAVSYQAGDTVTVNGVNFLATGSNPTAKLGLLAVTPGSVTDTSFQFTIPDNGLTATVSATNTNGSANSPTTLKVRPTITGDPAPNEAKAGEHVVISGKTFTGTASVRFGNNVQAAPFTIGVGGTSLNVTVPNNAMSGKIGITNAGGLTQTAGDFTIDPRINSFSPSSGAVGLVVTVNGTGFGGADRVNFAGGVFGVPTNVTATSLKVAVPAGATSGPITVHTAAGTSAASAASFTVTFSATSISPTSAVYNHDVTITGVGLTGVTAVKFNNVAGAIVSNTGTVIHVNTPASGAISGTVTVWKGTASVAAPQQFSLLDVSSFLPASATPGTDVVITGHGFTGATAVAFNGTAATFTVDSPTQITAQAPDAATTGMLSVTGPGGSTTSSGSFTVQSLDAVKINELQTDGTTSRDEFVELFNGGVASANISGCKLVYRTASGIFDVVLATVNASTTISAGGYYLFGGTDYAGTGPAVADQAFSVDLDATNGGLALRYPSGTIIDLVGYGTLTNGFFEGTAAASVASGQSIGRDPTGTDTDDNSADFTTIASPTPKLVNP
jgi:subtilisin family serine protease